MEDNIFMSQKNKRITLYRSFIVILSVLAVLVLLAAIYLFVTYEQDKKDNVDPVVEETTVETTTPVNETSSQNESRPTETTPSNNSTTAADNNTTAADDLEGAAKADKIVNDKVIAEFGANFKETYYIENIGLNNGKYTYCLRKSENTYAQKWYYVDEKSYELTME